MLAALAVNRGISMASYGEGDILHETMGLIREKLGNSIGSLTIGRIVIGIFFTGVKLSNGHGGICFTPVKDIPEAVCCPSSARAMPSAGRLRGRKVDAVLREMWGGNPLKKAIGIATMNALSSAYWEGHDPEGYVIKKGVDAFDELEIPEDAHVTVVGALIPVLKTLKKRGKPFSILEMDPRTLKEDEMEFYVPMQEAPAAIARADVLLVTGTTLINDTLEGILGHAKPGANILLVGPTASMLPEAFFARGVHSIGGITVTKPDALLDVLAEGGSGYHFFGRSAERVVIEKSE
jgi:uncharacterized protein (DUF4213/DUF364 family)